MTKVHLSLTFFNKKACCTSRLVDVVAAVQLQNVHVCDAAVFVVGDNDSGNVSFSH